ncbi:MAG: alpha/beta hydrolase-fold protein [Microbacterium sp.]
MALIEANFYAQTLERTVTFNAIIPTDKSLFSAQEENSDGAAEGFKTLYLLHGGLGNYTDWMGGTRIQMWAQEKNLAVVMPSGDNRWWIDDIEGSSMIGNYGRFLGEELIDFTRRTFPLSSRRQDTFIAGLSMGGYGALVNGLRFADTFGRIGVLSPGLMLGDLVPGYDEPAQPSFDALMPGNRRMMERAFGDGTSVVGTDRDYKGLITRLQQSGTDIPEIFLGIGTEDFLLERTREYHRFLQAHSVEHAYEEGPGGHDWIFWDAFIKKILDWLPLDERAADGRHSGNVLPSNH